MGGSLVGEGGDVSDLELESGSSERYVIGQYLSFRY
jgi:hypothetical protein